MKYLPIFDIYPISDGPVTSEELRSHYFAMEIGIQPNPLRNETIINTPLCFVQHCLTNVMSGVTWRYHQSLDAFLSNVGLKDEVSSYLDYYQNENYKVNFKALDDEILRNGFSLTPGQVVFHGGTFPYETGTLNIDFPFSTTFSPEVAVHHAFRQNATTMMPDAPFNIDSTVLILFISETCRKKCHVYFSCDSEMNYEYEVLFESGLSIQIVKKCECINYTGKMTRVLIGRVL
ncbi:hypothetical protein [Shewanella sp. SM21]|uniref:hypothetical protein n=1 Tax=Shewanella sp. SM21 TaxID=2912793 RepID=UPI0021D9AA2E|nr:hypothetical protein [Shewanella sp. SM21]MCU8087672.1 hypothetical protein [Shewanella sp. SM21]